jgi:signal peptidase II
MLWIIIIGVIAALDQITKYLIIQNIGPEDSITVIKNFFYLINIGNTGAAMGIFQNGRYIFILLTAIVGVVIAYMLVKSKNLIQKISLSFILGGAIGNFIDRLVKGSVTDFLDFYLGRFHFWTFNVADTFIVIGTILLAFYLLFIYKEDSEKTAAVKDLEGSDEK